MGCAKIAGLKIVRALEKGRLKQAFIVKLPWGEHAVAKRCMSYSCYSRNRIQEEADIFQKLHNQYGDEGALKYYGECYIPFVDFPDARRCQLQCQQKEFFCDVYGHFGNRLLSQRDRIDPFAHDVY